MKYLIILLALLVSGCMTVKRIEKYCDLFMTVCVTEVDTETETITENTTETQYGYTTIILHIPEKDVKDKKKCGEFREECWYYSGSVAPPLPYFMRYSDNQSER